MYLSPFAAPASPGSRAQHFAGAYNQVGVQTAVTGATPHQLVALLFDGFFGAINRARGAMQQGDVAGKGRAIGHAVRIVEEGLKASLNIEQGGRLAADLRDLYAYVTLRLTQANLRGDAAALDECVRLMEPLREAWASIGGQVGGMAKAS
jgi:flagellar protein FliS